jgi:bacillithiol system protein YtxJ
MLDGWKNLTQISEVDDAVAHSSIKPVVFFKHSTRCSISSMALNRLKSVEPEVLETADFYCLDLIAHRDVSNYIADKLDVHHESPQIVIVRDGDCTYDASHMEIEVKELISEIS